MSLSGESRLHNSTLCAADLMSKKVAAISFQASFAEAVRCLVDQNLDVIPVMGELGEPIGVLSITDLLIHIRESGAFDHIPAATVDMLMTPTIFTISPETPIDEIARDMRQSHVHHLFVVDEVGTITGVVNACDFLTHF